MLTVAAVTSFTPRADPTLHDSASYSVSTKKHWAMLFHVSSRGEQHPNDMQGELCVFAH